MIFVHILKLIAFSFIGFTITAYLPLMAVMIVSGAAGNWLGEVALHRMPEKKYRLTLKIILTLLALQLLSRAVAEAGLW
jgi:uncharacterized membrane protein YfcA